jgi:hypothetical protein
MRALSGQSNFDVWPRHSCRKHPCAKDEEVWVADDQAVPEIGDEGGGGEMETIQSRQQLFH